MKEKLTKRSVEAVQPGTGDVLVWDKDLPGFGLKVTPKGGRIYVLQYRHRNRVKRYTIGRHGIDVTAEAARKEALRLRGLIATGQDPLADRMIERSLPSVREFAERYMTEHAIPYKKPSSAATDRRNLDNHVIPLLGKLIVTDVGPADIARAVRDIAVGKTAKDEQTGTKRGRRIVEGGQGVANRVLALISKMFTLMEIWGIRPLGSNPCRHAKKFAEHKVERFLSAEELARLGAALAHADRDAELSEKNPDGVSSGSGNGNIKRAIPRRDQRSAITAIRLLLFTGCRLGEILNLEWSHVDLERRLLRLPDSKTGAKAVYLSIAAIQTLEAAKQLKGDPYVLPGRQAGKPIISLRGTWERLCKEANLDGLRLHDLRHSFASVGAAGGLSLPMIGALLGHSQPITTARYAHLAASPLHEAADTIGQRLSTALVQLLDEGCSSGS
jgi:integrase